MNAITTRTLEQVTSEIRYLDRQAKRLILGHALEIGRRLTEAKELVPYGEWGSYIKNELGYSQSTAQNFMRIFDEYGAAQLGLFGPEAESQTLGNLPYTKALKLLAIPAEEREAFVEANHVEDISTRELDALIRERDEEKRKNAQTETKLEELNRAFEASQEAVEERDRSIIDKNAEIYDLKEKVKALESRPVEVAVQRDEEAIRAAVAEAEKNAAEKLKAEKAAARELKEKLKQTELRAKTAEDSMEESRRLLREAENKLEAAGQEEALNAARAETEELRKQIAKAQAAEAAALFPVWQDSYNRLRASVERLPEENREKLKAAMKAQAKRWAE